VAGGPTAQAASTPFELLSIDANDIAVSGTTDVTASETGLYVAFAQPASGCSTLLRRDRSVKTTAQIGTGSLPTLTPKGDNAAFITCAPAPLAVARWKGGPPVPLTGITKVTELAVSSDAAVAAVVGDGASGPGLWLVDTATAKVTAVTSPNGAPKSPVFYNDGQLRLAFVSGTVPNSVAVSTTPDTPARPAGWPDGVTTLSASTDGATMAFAVGTAVQVLRRGSSVITLPGSGSEPSVSADGTAVAVTSGGSIATFVLSGGRFVPGPTAAPVADGKFGSPVATNGNQQIVFVASAGTAAGGSGSAAQAFALGPGLSAADVDFGTVAINTTATKTVSFRNDGTTPVTPTSVSSSNAGAFSVQSGGTCVSGTEIAIGASCTVPVAFTPTSNGAQESTLTLALQPVAWDAVQATVKLTGTGANGALTADPATIDFGTVTVGDTASARSFTVTNSGTLTTTIGTVLVSSPSEFPLAGGTCAGATLAPGDTCTVSVAFKPGTTGDRSATMDVGGSGGAAVSVALSGTGRTATPTTPPTTAARPVLSASPSSVDFGTVFIGAAGTPQTVTIRNTGTGATSPAVAVTGADAGDFAVTTNGCQSRSLSAGASCPLTVAFSPRAAGARSAALTVTGTGGASTTARLSGAGQLNPVLTLSLPFVVPGEVLTATGRNFAANVPVALAWDVGGPAAVTTADANGSFTVAVVAPQGAGNGTRLLVVTAPAEATAAQASVVVQPAALGFQGPASPAFRNSPG
jgi:Abnormal spindle-like microcephaly-assoc'd, ASPM-SPD-2-Hydin/HYDIN/CFA65/VesB-like, Ig-like domain/Cep192 domain 4